MKIERGMFAVSVLLVVLAVFSVLVFAESINSQDSNSGVNTISNSKSSNCHNFYWIDKNNTECQYKEFCGAFVYYGLQVFASERECLAVSGSNCRLYYWFDDINKNCGRKKFCNLYMYNGLNTFETKEECQAASGESGNTTVICTTEYSPVCCNIRGKHTTESNECVCISQKFGVKLYNGECVKGTNDSRVKIMPDTASDRAIQRLGQLGFNITLKEVGQDKKPVYDLQAEKDVKIFGFIKTKAKVSAEVDAETGDVIKVNKPWWAFLASGF